MSRSARLTAVGSKGESSDDPHAKRADAKKGCADARGSAFVCLDASGGLAAVPGMIEALRREFSGAAVNDADGIRFDLSDGWVHFRASNTEPIVRLIAEGVDDAAAAALADRAARGAGLG